METAKSLDELDIIIALLHDVQTSCSGVFTPRSLRLTAAKLRSRYEREGIGLLTKTFAHLGRALDRALTGEVSLNSVGFRKIPNSQLPRFLGELFQRIFSHDGWILPTPCVKCVKAVRQILYSYSKYKLPFSTDQELEVLNKFERTDDDLERYNRACVISNTCPHAPTRCSGCTTPFNGGSNSGPDAGVVERARQLLAELFNEFDPLDIYPKHGPGSVSTKETGPGKYKWSRVSSRIRNVYPLDAYYFASLGHVCDRLQELQNLEECESSAKVILVPKDSRGPRLISEEPLDFQWIQQGLHRAIVEHVERHALTKHNVHFTDQTNNRLGALLGSCQERLHWHSVKKVGIPYKLSVGEYATLDLKEASDRISIGLVNLLFPEKLLSYLMNTRSLSTVLPDGRIKVLNKFAPMGSALCFPVLALSIWAILTAASPDADTRESILVYGDDVVVKTAQAANAIHQLESFGLLVNRDKSCTTGFFRESCGLDAFRGEEVTPVRFRTVWTSARRPGPYTSYIAYANALYARGYYATYRLITNSLFSVYGNIPSIDMRLACPSLVEVPEEMRPKAKRTNKDLQRSEWRVWDLRTPRLTKEIDGWSMLLRYFAENVGRPRSPVEVNVLADAGKLSPTWLPFGATGSKFSASSYTNRDTEQLVKRWR